MPSYDYVCQQCGHQFELFQKMTDAPCEICPKCGGKVKRKIGPGAGIIFKGSGFYSTDYRSPEYKARQQAETGGSGSSGKDPAGSAGAGDKKESSGSSGTGDKSSGSSEKKSAAES